MGKTELKKTLSRPTFLEPSLISRFWDNFMQLHDCFALGKNDKVSPHACCSEIFPRRSSADTRTISLKALKDKSQSGELAKKKTFRAV